MASCYQCGKAQAQVGLLCRECVEHNKARRISARSSFQQQVDARRNYAPTFFDKPYIWYGCLVVVFLIALRLFGVFGYGTLPALNLGAQSNLASDPCTGKERCLVIFLAPWCPACKGSLPFVRAAAHYAYTKPNLGFLAVIGLDDNENMRQMAGNVGLNAYLDRAGLFYRALGKGGVPRWGVIDKNRAVVNRGSGLPGGLTADDPQFEPYVLRMLALN